MDHDEARPHAGAPPASGATIVAPDDATDPARGSTPRRAETPVALHRGARLGRWILEEKLGDGATASVWSAKHEQLGAPVAIKVFHRRDLPFHAVLGEARAAAGIPSRNAIWVYDVDTFGGHQAIVMELCADEHGRATSLREAEVRDARVAARIVAEAARGVAAAHACEVFHKDIKPANILLNPGDGRAQIADFGLANPALWRNPTPGRGRTAQSTVFEERAVVPADAHDPWAAVRGSLRLGTPEFMAPEQAAGLRRDLDPADPVDRRHLAALDVYGLGATLWYLLADRSPYPRDPDADPPPGAIMDEVVAGPPDDLVRVAKGTPRRLARIVEKAMHRDPLARHPSASALADDLEAWLAGRPTSIDRGPLVRAAVHLSRERARVGLLVALALVTLGSSWIVVDNAREIASQQAALARVEQDKARVLDDLAQAEDALKGAKVQIQAKDGLLQERGHALADREQQLATTSAALSTTKDELTSRGLALDQALDRIAQAEAVLARLDAELADTRTLLDRARADGAASRAEAAAVTRQRDDLADDLASLQRELTAQRVALDRLARDDERTRQRADTAEAQVRVLRAQLQRLEAATAQAAAPAPAPTTDWNQLAPASQPAVP